MKFGMLEIPDVVLCRLPFFLMIGDILLKNLGDKLEAFCITLFLSR